jgi:methionine-rich copper-binding protein CopC
MKRVVLGVLLVASLLACGTQGVTPQNNGNGNGNNGGGDTAAPTLTSSTPSNSASSIAVNSNIRLTFSEKMDTASVTVIADPNSDLGDPAWNAAGTELRFDPPANLETSSDYTLNIAGKDVAGNALAATGVQFTTAGDNNPPPPVDTTAPTIASTSPDDGSNGKAINSNILVTFSEAMNPGSVSVSINPSVNLGAASFKSANSAVEFNPPADLAGNTTYTVNVSGKDVAGNDLTGSSSFSFKTATIADTTAPGIPQNVVAEAGESQIKFTWSANTEPDLKGYTIYYSNNASNLSSSVFVSKPGTSKTLTGLTNGEIYFYQLEAEDGAGNRSGRTITKNATPKDATAPRLLSSSPANGAVNVPASSKVVFNFSEAMNPDKSKPRRPCVPLAGRANPYCGVLDTAVWDNGGKRLTLTYASNLIGRAVEPTYNFETTEDKAGNPLPLTQIKFSLIEDPAPTLLSGTPGNGAVNVPVDANIVLTFSRPMDKASVQSRFATVNTGVGVISWDGTDTTMTFNPFRTLLASGVISWSLSAGAQDKVGNSMVNGAAATFNVVSVSRVVSLKLFGYGSVVSVCTRSDNRCGNIAEPNFNGVIMRIGDIGGEGFYGYRQSFISFPINQLPRGARITQASLRFRLVGNSGLPFQALGDLILERVNVSQIVEQGYRLPATSLGLPALPCVGCPFVFPNTEAQLEVATAVIADINEGHALAQFRLRFARSTNLDRTNDSIDFAKDVELIVAYDTP